MLGPLLSRGKTAITSVTLFQTGTPGPNRLVSLGLAMRQRSQSRETHSVANVSLAEYAPGGSRRVNCPKGASFVAVLSWVLRPDRQRPIGAS